MAHDLFLLAAVVTTAFEALTEETGGMENIQAALVVAFAREMPRREWYGPEYRLLSGGNCKKR